MPVDPTFERPCCGAGHIIAELTDFDAALNTLWERMERAFNCFHAWAHVLGGEETAALHAHWEGLRQVYGDRRHEILKRLDEHGGASLRLRYEPWPIPEPVQEAPALQAAE